MAHNFNTAQMALLRAPNIRARLLTTWFMDDGVYRYTDHIEDLTIDGVTWIGASAIAACSSITSPQGLSSESVTIDIDGTLLFNAGMEDPTILFNMILELPLSNRPLEIELGLGYDDADEFILRLPLLSGLINHAKLVDPQMQRSAESLEAVQPKLQIVVDSIAQRYSWVTNRLRTHQDQQGIDPTDRFFEYVHLNQVNESKLYWGRATPTSSGVGSGGGRDDYDYVQR